VRDVLVFERLNLGVGRRPSTSVSPSTTTVPVATPSRRMPVKWPVKPGNVVVLLVVSIGPVPSQVISTVTDRPPRVVIVPVTLACTASNTRTATA
jgi:hypothetical protein